VDLLLDTHAFIWWDVHDSRLNEMAYAAIADPENRVVVSAASVWEISIKRMTGKLSFHHDTLGALSRNSFEPFSITAQHADLAGSLPLHHTDPAAGRSSQDRGIRPRDPGSSSASLWCAHTRHDLIRRGLCYAVVTNEQRVNR
jgi:PIN domain nuclease of toxin-antitoxin system